MLTEFTGSFNLFRIVDSAVFTTLTGSETFEASCHEIFAEDLNDSFKELRSNTPKV